MAHEQNKKTRQKRYSEIEMANAWDRAVAGKTICGTFATAFDSKTFALFMARLNGRIIISANEASISQEHK